MHIRPKIIKSLTNSATGVSPWHLISYGDRQPWYSSPARTRDILLFTAKNA
jgi:hypothetical protein